MENKLSVIVKESGLEKSKAQVLLDNFSAYFEIAGEWEKRAKALVVTDASQEADMKMARVGRLFLRQKRIAIEHTRKELKEQSLREGKAIDGIANVLKALIIPIEEHLEKQERYIEIKATEEAERKRIEEEKKAEEERIAMEKADKKRLQEEFDERERIRKENLRLKKEAEQKERERIEERAREEKARKEIEAAAERERRESERKLKVEKERREKELAIEREKAEKERIEAEEKQRAVEEKARKEREEAERKTKLAQARFRELQAEREKAEAEKEALKANMITCPFCHKSFKLEQDKE